MIGRGREMVDAQPGGVVAAVMVAQVVGVALDTVHSPIKQLIEA